MARTSSDESCTKRRLPASGAGAGPEGPSRTAKLPEEEEGLHTDPTISIQLGGSSALGFRIQGLVYVPDIATRLPSEAQAASQAGVRIGQAETTANRRLMVCVASLAMTAVTGRRRCSCAGKMSHESALPPEGV